MIRHNENWYRPELARGFEGSRGGLAEEQHNSGQGVVPKNPLTRDCSWGGIPNVASTRRGKTLKKQSDRA